MSAQTQVDASPNTSDSAEPVVINSGDAPTTFDDLESAVGPSKEDPVEEPKEEPKQEEPEEEPKKAAEKESKEESEPSEKVDEPTDQEEEPSEEIAAKTLEFQLGDEKVQVPADAMFPVKIRGKVEEFSVQDIVNEFSGKTDYTRKYNELNRERQVFERDRDTLQRFANELHSKLNEKDVIGAVWTLTEAMGGNPPEVISQFQAQLVDKAKEMNDLSPEEQRARMAEEKLDLYKRQQDSLAQKREEQKESEAIQTRVEQVIQEKNMTEERFSELFNELQGAAKQGSFDISELTPELVGDYHAELESRDAISSMLKDVASELSGQDFDNAVSELRKVMTDNKSFTVEDLKDIAIEAYGTKKAQNLSRKLKKANKPADTAKPSAERMENPISFDDIT